MAKSTKQSKPKAAKRDATGRFVRGHKGGPGRPCKAREEQVARSEGEFLRLFRKCISVDDFEGIVRSHIRSAKKGSVRSAELLLRHLLPQPTARTVIEQTLFHSFDNDGGLRVAGGTVADYDAAFLRKMADCAENGDPMAAEFNALISSLLKRPDATPKPYPPTPHRN